eukprot:8150785-Karenia_brevis.AAC.1
MHAGDLRLRRLPGYTGGLTTGALSASKGRACKEEGTSAPRLHAEWAEGCKGGRVRGREVLCDQPGPQLRVGFG